MNEQQEQSERNDRQTWQTPEVDTFAARDVYAVLTTSSCGGSGQAAIEGGGGDPGDCTAA